MSICDELKKQAMQTYAEGIDKSIETAAACFRLCAEGLSRFSDDGGGSYPIQDISLLIACSAVSGGWNIAGSADKERMSERLKLYVKNLNSLCDDLPLALTVPGYANIERNLMSPPQITAFTEHLTRLFKTLDEHEKMAVVTMHYLMLYAVFEEWPQVDVLKAAYENAPFSRRKPTSRPRAIRQAFSSRIHMPLLHSHLPLPLPDMNATQSVTGGR